MPHRHASLRAIEAAAAEVVSLDELAGLPLELAGAALGASGTLLYRHEADGSPTAEGGSLAPAVATYTRDLLDEDPLQHAMRRAPLPRAVITPRAVQLDERRFRRSGAYQDFYRRYDMERLLGLSLTGLCYGAPEMTGLLFTRGRREEEFGPDDEALLDEVALPLRAAVRRIARLEAARRGLDALAAARSRPGEARVILDRRGELAWACPAARAHGLERSPDELRRAVAAWRSGGAVPTVRGRRAEVAALDRSGAVLVELRAPAERDPIDALTPAERRVLAHLGEGASNRAIADALEVSVETVRTHVRRILDKLGVDSRVKAALSWQRRTEENR